MAFGFVLRFTWFRYASLLNPSLNIKLTDAPSERNPETFGLQSAVKISYTTRQNAISANLGQLCAALVRADSNIRDILLFGSAAYAPDQALDIDLLVTTTKKKSYDTYLDAVARKPGNLNVDVAVREPGEKIGGSLALAVCATRRILYGNGETLQEAMSFMPVPTYDDAREYLTLADRGADVAHNEPQASLRDKAYRQAFDLLFHAVRHAAMTFLCTENPRWGELRRALPTPFSRRFRQITNTLAVHEVTAERSEP